MEQMVSQGRSDGSFPRPRAAEPSTHLGLSLVQRILLTTDGTVSKILEQFAGEPIEVVKLTETIGPSLEQRREVEANAGEVLLWRRVVLRGQCSLTPFLYAESSLRIALLPPGLLEVLSSTDTAIGQLLRERRTETFREVFDEGREQAGTSGQHLEVAPSSDLAFRTYHIYMNGLPAVLITEKFAVDGPLSRIA